MTRLPVPGPRDLLRLTTGGYQALEQAIGLLPRVTALIGEIERIVSRADTLVTEVERTRQRTDAVVAQSGALVERTAKIVDAADGLLGRTSGLLTDYQPALDRLAPLVDQLASTTSPDEVAAAIKLIDELPRLVEALQRDILPILATLDNVGPDVRELLNTTKEFNEVLGSVPGLGRIKKRVEEERAEDERAEQLDGTRE
jgi:ABC-type transporter Mla subunit MlaD